MKTLAIEIQLDDQEDELSLIAIRDATVAMLDLIVSEHDGLIRSKIVELPSMWMRSLEITDDMSGFGRKGCC